MLKVPLALLLLIGTCAAQDDQSLVQLQGTSRVLIVFSPDSNSPSYKRQLQLIEHHIYELTELNTVVVPVAMTSHGTEERYWGENLPLGSPGEQESARTRFHVQPGQFVVVLLNPDGTERVRFGNPVDIHDLISSLDQLPRHRPGNP